MNKLKCMARGSNTVTTTIIIIIILLLFPGHTPWLPPSWGAPATET
jgi:hypothetical protein